MAMAARAFTVKYYGTINVNEKRIADKDLERIFQAAFTRDKNTQIVIRADAGVSHGLASLLAREPGFHDCRHVLRGPAYGQWPAVNQYQYRRRSGRGDCLEKPLLQAREFQCGRILVLSVRTQAAGLETFVFP